MYRLTYSIIPYIFCTKNLATVLPLGLCMCTYKSVWLPPLGLQVIAAMDTSPKRDKRTGLPMSTQHVHAAVSPGFLPRGWHAADPAGSTFLTQAANTGSVAGGGDLRVSCSSLNDPRASWQSAKQPHQSQHSQHHTQQSNQHQQSHQWRQQSQQPQHKQSLAPRAPAPHLSLLHPAHATWPRVAGGR